MRRRHTFTADTDLTCPHCGEGPVEVLAAQMIWTHECGAYGYYDDGAKTFPRAIYRVKGESEARQP